MWCVLSRVVVVWQALRQVAVSPGGALPGPAGWTRTLWTLQIRPNRSSSARSASSYSLKNAFAAISLFSYSLFSIFFPLPLCCSFCTSFSPFSMSAVTLYHFIIFSQFICICYQPPIFSNHFLLLSLSSFFSSVLFFAHLQPVETHIYSSHTSQEGLFPFFLISCHNFLFCRFKKFLSSLPLMSLFRSLMLSLTIVP